MYLDLKVGAKARLQYLKNKFDNHSKDYPHCPEYAKPKSWRDLRYTNFRNQPGPSMGTNSDGLVWVSLQPEFRNTRATGASWYTDSDYSEEVEAIVANLTHGRFVAGYRWSANGEHVYYPKVFDDEDSAKEYANSVAESFGSETFEDSIRQGEYRKLEIELEDHASDLEYTRFTLKMAYQLRHSGIEHEGLTPASICRSKIKEIRNLSSKIAKLEKELEEWDD